jgi:hypothetical protein
MAAATGLVLRPRATSSIAIDNQFAMADYSGNSACAGCHKRQSENFAQTGHAQALSRADHFAATEPFTRNTPEDANGDLQLRGIEYQWTDGQLWAQHSSDPSNIRVPVQWCFGSGQFGTTLVTLLQDRMARTRLLEHHWSWFRDGDLLAITPGHALSQSGSGVERLGVVYPPSTARQCFACHATSFRYEAGHLDSGSVVPGIQCERCHGPRKEHVAIRMRDSNAIVASNRTPVSAREQIYACGECHRRPDEINDAIRTDNPLIARFPPVGLVQSKCFLASEANGTLTCTTCHDPHRAERPAAEFYNKRCGDCHDPTRSVENVRCSMQPTNEDCVACHMPRVKLYERLKFTDHWIRIVRSQ